jgi:cell division septal protein FtsQ
VRPRSEAVADNTGRLRPGQPTPVKKITLLGQIARRFGMLVLLIVIVAAVVNVLSVTPKAKIEPLSSSRADSPSPLLRNKTEYQAAADKLLASSIWNRNKITINTSQISQQLTKQFPELTGVSVTLPLLAHRPVIYLQPARAVLVIAAKDGAYVIDQNGRALMPSANLPTASKLPQIVDQSGLHISVGRQVLTSDDVAFVQTIMAELAAKHVSVTSIVLPATSRELDVYIDHQLYFIKFNLANNDARQQAGTYLATVAELKRQHVTPKHYIDVRVDGRAYYK